LTGLFFFKYKFFRKHIKKNENPQQLMVVGNETKQPFTENNFLPKKTSVIFVTN